MVNMWARDKTGEAVLNNGWRLAVGGRWRLAVGGPWALSLGIVLTRVDLRRSAPICALHGAFGALQHGGAFGALPLK